MPPIPDSFFAEPEYSDEDLDEIIHGGCPPRINESNDCHAPASTLSSQQSSTSTKSVRQTTYFNPINTLYPKPRSKPEARAPQKLGAGYSQRARDAFSDLDDDEDDNPSSSMCDTGTPEPFRRWMSNYETSFTCHLGFCSVADGPFEGLIRAGSQKGSYLPGYAPPSPTSVAQCEKTATPKDCPRDSDFSDYDSSAEHDVKENDSNFERLPIVIPESAKTTRSTESDSTSVLIMRQLSQDVPPSNQELGILMSSSPLQSGIYHAEKLARSSSVRLASANVVDASEVSPKPLSQADGSKISSNDPVLVGTPKSGRHSQHYDADLDVTPNFERALSQVETPSTRSRSSQKLAGQLESDYSNEVLRSTTGKVVVKIPELSAQRRAEYKKVAESLEQGPLAAPLRSFKEINGKLEDAHHFSQDSGVAAIDQVLKASPAWLANITEVMPRLLNTAEKTSHILGSQMNTTPDKIIVAACRKRKVDETKSQDPTYQPSRFNSHSDSSHQSKGYGSRKAAKKEVEATPGKASRETKFTSRTSVLEIPSKAAAVPVMELGTAANRSGLVSSTPVPPPSISDILEIIKDTPIKPTSHGQSSTIPPKYTSHFKQERHKTGQANKSHQRRKEETSRNDCELETTIDSTMSDDGSVSVSSIPTQGLCHGLLT